MKYTIQIKTRESKDWNAFNINTLSDITPKQAKETTKEKAVMLMNRLIKEFSSLGCLFRIQKSASLY